MAPSSLRDTVLRAAVDYIADHGPDGLSFRQVAADAGVSHQAPYHHFSNREGIFQAIAMEGFIKFSEALRASEQDPNSDTATAMLESYVEFAVTHRGHFRVMFRADLCSMSDNPELKHVADDSFGVLVDFVRRMLGDTSSIEEIRARATAMWALAHGLATLLIDGPLEAEIGLIADRKALIRAVAAQTGLGSGR